MKTQYEIGQKVAVRIHKGSNYYRSLPKGHSNIVESEIIKIGKKYITVKIKAFSCYGNEIKFECRYPEIYYNKEFELYPNINSALEGQKAVEISEIIRKKIEKLFHYDSTDINYRDVVSINEILNKYISDEVVKI